MNNILCLSITCILFSCSTLFSEEISYSAVRQSGIPGVLGDIHDHAPADRLRHYLNPRDLTNEGHELLHYVNSTLRIKRNGNPSFYLGGNRAFTFAKTTKVRLIDVARAVPQHQRNYLYRLYVLQQSSAWNDEPLYLFDEATAYLAGCRVALDKQGPNSYNEERFRASLANGRQVLNFCKSLVNLIETLEPDYVDLDALKSFLVLLEFEYATLE